jgi:hypothetical protein
MVELMSSASLKFENLVVGMDVATPAPSEGHWNYLRVEEVGSFCATLVDDKGDAFPFEKYRHGQLELFDANSEDFRTALEASDAFSVAEAIYHGRYKQLKNPKVRQALLDLSQLLDEEDKKQTLNMLRSCGSGGKKVATALQFLKRKKT